MVRFVRQIRLRQPRVGTRKLHYLLQGQDDGGLKAGPELVTPVAPEQVWVADITYLPARSGPLYLSLVTDAYSRKIVGHHVHEGMHAESVQTGAEATAWQRGAYPSLGPRRAVLLGPVSVVA